MNTMNDPSTAPSPRVIAPSFISFNPQGLHIFSEGQRPPAIIAELASGTSLPITVQWQIRTEGSETWENYLPEMIMNSISAIILIGSVPKTQEYRVMVSNSAGSIISPAVKFLYNHSSDNT